MNMKRFVSFLAVGASLLWAGPGWAGELVTPLPSGSQLVLEVPADWKAEHRTAGPAVHLEFSPASQGEFLVLLTVIPVQPGAPVLTAEGVRGLVEERAREALKTALQERVELYEVRGEQAFGWLFHVTDRNPERGPGDFREANQGAVLVGQHLLSVTVLTHTGDLATVEAAKGLLGTARIKGAESSVPGNMSSSRRSPMPAAPTLPPTPSTPASGRGCGSIGWAG